MLDSAFRLPMTLPVADGTGPLFQGTSGDDTQTGTSGNDTFDYSQGGHDHLFGGDGADTFQMGAAFDALDQIDGGTGDDTLSLDGDYFTSNQITTTATTFAHIETIQLEAGNSYALTIDEDNIPEGSLTLDASHVSHNRVVFFHADFDDDIDYLGGVGRDNVTLGNGTHHIQTGGGADDVVLTGDFDDNDAINGGKGFDIATIGFAGSSNVFFGPNSLRAVEILRLQMAPNQGDAFFNVTMDDANVAANATLLVNAFTGAGTNLRLTFNGTAETNGHYEVFDTPGNDVLRGGAKGDTFHMSRGDDAIEGGSGGDLVDAPYTDGAFTPSLSAADVLDGGDGFDTLQIAGDYSETFTFGTDIINFEELLLADGFDYNLELNPVTVGSGTFVVDASALGPLHSLSLDADATAGRLTVTGGAGDDGVSGGAKRDEISGGGGDDFLAGFGGADRLEGGHGDDTYDYGPVSQSTGPGYDTIAGFDTAHDVFALGNAVVAVDTTVVGGHLATATFNDDLVEIIDGGALGKSHAVVFKPDSGSLAGSTFLIVDGNEHAGYQRGHDYVFLLDGASHLNQLDVSNFILD